MEKTWIKEKFQYLTVHLWIRIYTSSSIKQKSLFLLLASVFDESFSMPGILNLLYILQLTKDLRNNIAVVNFDNEINRVLFSSDHAYIICHRNIVDHGSAVYLGEPQKAML